MDAMLYVAAWLETVRHAALDREREDEAGQGTLEYALLAAVVIVAGVIAAKAGAPTMGAVFQAAMTQVQNALTS